MSAGTILVTGGAGYVGSHFAARLADDRQRFVVLDDLSRGHESFIAPENLIRGDIGDTALVERICREFKVDVCVHFAAFAYVGESCANPAIYYENNVAKMVAFLGALRRNGVRKLVFSSSCATYGEREGEVPISEGTVQAPLSPYGRSKLMAEQILSDYDRAYGSTSIALRYFNAAGASEKHALYEHHDPETHLIPLTIDAALGAQALTIFGSDYPTPDGTCVRDYIHVDDLADAHALAVERLRSDGASLRANLGTGSGTSVLNIVRSVERITGTSVRRNLAKRRAGDAAMLVADPRLAYRELGWQPRYREADAIVRTAVAGYGRAKRSHGGGAEPPAPWLPSP